MVLITVIKEYKGYKKHQKDKIDVTSDYRNKLKLNSGANSDPNYSRELEKSARKVGQLVNT